VGHSADKDGTAQSEGMPVFIWSDRKTGAFQTRGDIGLDNPGGAFGL